MTTPPPDEFWPRPEGSTTHETQPILPPGSAVDPPPSGLPGTRDAAESTTAGDAVDWHGRYEQQHKRTRIFMATTAAAVAALLGSVFFAVAQGGAASPGSTTPAGIGRPFQGPDGRGSLGGPQSFDHHLEWEDHHDEEYTDDATNTDDA